MKMLGFSSFLAIVSLAIPLSGTNMAWVNDADYSFLTQVALILPSNSGHATK